MNTALFQALRRTLDACAELDRRGLRIQSANVNARAPLITIDPQPESTFVSYSKVRIEGRWTFYTTIRGIRVEYEPTDQNTKRRAA